MEDMSVEGTSTEMYKEVGISSDFTTCPKEPEKWNIFSHISKQKMSQSSTIAATLDGDPVSPKGAGRKEYLPSSSHQTVAPPDGEPWGDSYGKMRDTGPS